MPSDAGFSRPGAIHIGVRTSSADCTGCFQRDASAFDFSNRARGQPGLCATRQAEEMQQDGTCRTVEATIAPHDGRLYDDPG